MCGRYVLKAKIQDLSELYGAKPLSLFDFEPIYNVAPTFDMPIILKQNEYHYISFYRWGLVPFWAKEVNTGYSMINAKAETLSQKKSFAKPFQHQRCIIPASGFYEWEKASSGKIPHYITLSNEGIMSFAGLYEHWKSPDGQQINSFTIITTEANQTIKPLHNRMPVILLKDEVDEWLNPNNQSIRVLQKLLRPYPDDYIKYRTVSKEVNNPNNQGSHLIE